MKNILVTGCAGFIGFHLSNNFLNQKNKYKIYGVDNLNTYYDIKLKKKRLEILRKNKQFFFKKINLSNSGLIKKFLKNKKIDIIYHLAAQAGVRYSKKNPDTYVKSNIVGFYNLLESIKNKKIKKFIYASSSSVYSEKNKKKYNEKNSLLEPNSLYALTKVANEEFGKFYQKKMKIPFICLRFFTVYGPMGRPDMAYSIFRKKIIKKKIITLYNHGKNLRDMTYIDDVINILVKLKSIKILNGHTIFNIGGENPISNYNLMKLIENKLNSKARFRFVKRDKIEVLKTFSNSNKIKKFLNFKKFTDIKNGIADYINSF